MPTAGTVDEKGNKRMSEFVQLKTPYPIPELLQKDIDALQKGVEDHVSYIDCLQDEVRASAHGVTGEGGLTEEQAENIITYYCRRRW